MRLICPNCDAEYQVDDAAIPEAGRDVQCSNCGHAWFQMHTDMENAREAEDEVFGDAPAETEMAAVSAPIPQAMPVATTVPEDAKSSAEPEPAEEDAPSRPGASRQTIAESVLSVLREEAEREKAVRREEDPALRGASAPGNLETQTEFGLETDAQSASASATARHIARLKGADPDGPAAAEPKAMARRDLLPDIEEINSTLRADSDRVQADEDDIDALPDLTRRRSGFRSGFVLLMIIAVAAAMAYIMAPRIIAQIPGSGPAMRAYVTTVDEARLWLDGVMKSASGSLRSFSGDGT